MNYNSYETSYTSYGGGGGGGGGGGFMPGEGSQQSPGGQRERINDTIRAVTIKQIFDAQPESSNTTKDQLFKIDGTVAPQVTFVAQIRNVSTQSLFITYRLDDGTGIIEAKQWINADTADEPNPARAKLVEGVYCRAWGKLRSNPNDRKQVMAEVLRPIENMNEVSYHLLEATAVHLYFTRGPLGANTTNGAAGQQQAVGGGGDGALGGMQGHFDLSGFNQIARRVFQYIRNAPQSNEGLHQQEIAAKLGIDTGDVARAGDDLLAGGLIYTTVDDQTWALLEEN